MKMPMELFMLIYQDALDQHVSVTNYQNYMRYGLEQQDQKVEKLKLTKL